MLYHLLLCFFMTVDVIESVQFSMSPSSDMSIGDRGNFGELKENKTSYRSEMEEETHEMETESLEEDRDKKFLADAMNTVLDPTSVIGKHRDITKPFQKRLTEIQKGKYDLDSYIEKMDNLSLVICKNSQEALWSYVTDINNEVKKLKMFKISAEEDEIKNVYWDFLKRRYLKKSGTKLDQKAKRKIQIIQDKAINAPVPYAKRDEIESMQKIWSRALVCQYNSTSCPYGNSLLSMADLLSIFKTSNDSKELSYYWKAYRDKTGPRIKPIFNEYVIKSNILAQAENFTDVGDMWRHMFDDDTEAFVKTVKRIWSEIKPLYNDLHEYTRKKLKLIFPDEFQQKSDLIPAHLLGNLWAQEWQSLYQKLLPYPKHVSTRSDVPFPGREVPARELFDIVDDYHVSLGFNSSKESYAGVVDGGASNCLPSSHDMCDGVHYRIKWCADTSSDFRVRLARAARLLGHVQYFKHYQHQPFVFRDGPNPAFHDALSDAIAIQVISPKYVRMLGFPAVEFSPEETVNHLLWLALEKLPLMGFAYVLDRWRWDIFGHKAPERWNQHWWHLREEENGISPPVARTEDDLDPASKYHVVSHVQYITYLISNVLEFQILKALCRTSGHVGPLNECILHGNRKAGSILKKGMSLGASEDWRTVLKQMTGETELSTDGIREYFAPLQQFLQEENSIPTAKSPLDMDKSVPILIGGAIAALIALIVLLYCMKKHEIGAQALSVCGLNKNGSLDIETSESPNAKQASDTEVVEDKV